MVPRGRGRGCGGGVCTRQDGDEFLGFLDFGDKKINVCDFYKSSILLFTDQKTVKTDKFYQAQ